MLFTIIQYVCYNTNIKRTRTSIVNAQIRVNNDSKYQQQYEHAYQNN